ncbi:MAG: hypothetical protein SFT68_02450 [Rickettsiaceae bacterium]|nr:hypothetical protein [Rickettsiaceae bacterium]
MITLFASLTGFISSMIPEFIKFLKDKNDKKHELEILELQIEVSKLSKKSNLEEIRYDIDSKELTTLYSTFKSGIYWIDALNGTVRPILAYSFFFLYTAVKYAQYKTIISNDEIQPIYFDMLWTMDDQAIFAGIVSFYFGQRTFGKLWRQR